MANPIPLYIIQNVVLSDDHENMKLLIGIYGFNFCVQHFSYIYIYIYIYRERERERQRMYEWYNGYQYKK